MNEFAAKKLGEVLAFAVVGTETLKRAGQPFAGIFTDVSQLIKDQDDQQQAIIALAETAGNSDITLPKSEATAEKLRGMRDAYIGDEWDNPTEVMEWLGFFEGSATVHWSLVAGAAEGLENAELGQLAEQATAFHRGFLGRVEQQLKTVGREKAAG